MSEHRTFKRNLALVCMSSMCCLNVLPLPYVTPEIAGNGCPRVSVTGIGALKSVTCGSALYSIIWCDKCQCGFACEAL